MDFSFQALAQEARHRGADRRDEEKETDGVGEEARGDEDGPGKEDDEALEGLAGGHPSLPGRFLKFQHGPASLRFGESRPEDRGDDDDRNGFGKAELATQGHEKIKLGQRDEGKEEEEFAKHGFRGR